MNRELDTLRKVQLFAGIDADNIVSMLGCLSARRAEYKKNETIIMAGDRLRNVGIILEGQVQIQKEDHLGNRTIMSSLSKSELYGEAICCAGLSESPVSVVAAEDCRVLLIDFERILNVCSNTCVFHSKLIENMMFVLARKNLFLQNRMDIVTVRSVRARVLMYLESFSEEQGSFITIPLNREQMAEYLCVDRSALSHELIRMKKEGILNYYRNTFELLG